MTMHPKRSSAAHEVARLGPGRRSGEGGQALVLFAITLAVICGAMALVLDQGLLRKANQDLWNSLDAGALAGVAELPSDGVAADLVARRYVESNFPAGIPSPDLDVSFRCLIGSQAGSPRLTDVPAACDPGPGMAWACDDNICTAVCDPVAGDVCNTIVVASPAGVDYNFGPVLDVLRGDVGTRISAACKGPCGQAPEVPVDIVMVLDRTTSMSGVDTENARSAADAVRRAYDPRVIHMGLSMLGPSRSGASCVTQADSTIGTARTPGDLRRWVPVGMSGIGASVNDQDFGQSSSVLSRAIACFGNSSTQTDIADPVRMATYELETHGRKNVKQAILVMSDGQPNISTTGTTNYCQEANDAATAAKAKGIEVVAVGFGLDGSNNILCGDRSGPWVGKYATALLASMATDSVDAGCPGGSNEDGDRYFCVPKSAGASTDLSNIFKAAVGSLSGHTRLIKLP